MPPQTDIPITVRNTVSEWFIAAAFCALVFTIMICYHDWWRNKPYSLGTANESFGLAGTMGVAAALILGPLYRLTGWSRAALRLRRPLGMIAGVCMLLHLACVAGPLRHEYAGDYWMKTGNVASLVFGIAAGALLALLLLTAWPALLTRLGARRWRQVQCLAFPLLVLILLHYLVLDKAVKWLAWFRIHDLPAPAGTFPITICCLVVLVVRAIDAIAGTRRPATTTQERKTACTSP